MLFILLCVVFSRQYFCVCVNILGEIWRWKCLRLPGKFDWRRLVLASYDTRFSGCVFVWNCHCTRVTFTQDSQGAEGSGAATEGASTSGGLPHYTNILDTIRAFKKREFRPSPRVCIP